jgi:hypothetical protein
MTHQTIGGVTQTVCTLFGIEDEAAAPVEDSFAAVLARTRSLGIDRCDRVLLYAPDAIGLHLCEAFPDIIRPVAQETSIVVQMKSVVPPVTPVCFSTMFTGQPPAVHGIRKYEKPALKSETLFDRLVNAGKRVAIVAVQDSSIDRLFRGRAVDYFSEPYDPGVTETTLRLVTANQHDFVLAYHQEYDDIIHRTTPRSEEAIEAMRRHVASFVRLTQAVAQSWRSQHRVLGFVPDHGSHIDPETGKGTHGLDVPEDMDVQHFYGVFRGRAAEG